MRRRPLEDTRARIPRKSASDPDSRDRCRPCGTQSARNCIQNHPSARWEQRRGFEQGVYSFNPAAWPALLPGLLRAISSQDNLPLVSGSLSCLSMFADELDEDHIIQVGLALVLVLLDLKPAHALLTRTRARSAYKAAGRDNPIQKHTKCITC